MSVLSMNNGSFSYDGDKTVFSNLSFEVSGAEMFCILGPNGIGKSTLLRSLMNLYSLRDGSVTIDGTDIRSMKQRTLAKRISFIPTFTQFAFPYKVLDVVLMGRTPHLNPMAQPGEADYERAYEALQIMEIEDLSHRPCSQLSAGQLQLTMLARAITQEADFLLLDEPTSNLDYGKQQKTLRTIKNMTERGIGVIMTSHNPNHALQYCDKVALMNEGRFIAVGSPGDVIRSESLKEIYGINIELIEHKGRKMCFPETL